MLYSIFGDEMKKILPYIFSLIVGSVFGFLLLNNEDVNIAVFSSKINATAFQIGVFNSIDLAKEYVKKYPSSIIVAEDDVFRVYISVLTNNKCISKMEEYLNNEKVSFYKKDIVVNDSGLIKALQNYEKSMLDGNNETFISINKLIMESYGGGI